MGTLRNHTELLKAVLCAGLFPNVVKAHNASGGKGGVTLTQQKQTLQIHPSSFNRASQRFDSGWLVYHEKVATGKIYIHDCTTVTALDLFLFGAEPQILHAQHRILIDGWIDMRISPRTAVLFKGLRKQLLELMASRIDGKDDDGDSSSSSGSKDGAEAAARERQKEKAQEAILSSLVTLIGKGIELQADEVNAAALIAKKQSQTPRR